MLMAALQIHSVEARHASVIRRLRGMVSGQAINGWITGKESNGAPQASCDGEENITHATISLDSIASLACYPMNTKTGSFNEPLKRSRYWQ